MHQYSSRSRCDICTGGSQLYLRLDFGCHSDTHGVAFKVESEIKMDCYSNHCPWGAVSLPLLFSDNAKWCSASVATVLRIAYVGGLSAGSDFLYTATDFALWSGFETGIGIAACCFITLRPLFREFFMRIENTRPPTPGLLRTLGLSKNTRAGNSNREGPNHDEYPLRSDLTAESGATTLIARESLGARPNNSMESEVSHRIDREPEMIYEDAEGNIFLRVTKDSDRAYTDNFV